MNTHKKVTLKELLIELSGFQDDLINWCNTYPEFLNALKNVYPEKFIQAAITVEHGPISEEGNCKNDVVMGVYTYHYEKNKPIFKQDFIVNKGNLGKEFILYTRTSGGSSKYVKDIKEFFIKYGKYGYDTNVHHMSLNDLPLQLHKRAKQAIKLAKKMQKGAQKEISQELIDKTYEEVMSIDRKDRIVKEKLIS